MRIVILICVSISKFIKQSNKSDVENESELEMSLCVHALKFFPTRFRCLPLTTQMKFLNRLMVSVEER